MYDLLSSLPPLTDEASSHERYHMLQRAKMLVAYCKRKGSPTLAQHGRAVLIATAFNSLPMSSQATCAPSSRLRFDYRHTAPDARQYSKRPVRLRVTCVLPPPTIRRLCAQATRPVQCRAARHAFFQR